MTAPLTWPLDCVNGNDQKSLNEMVTFSQWASKKQLVTIKGVQKEKYVFSMYRETTTESSN